MSGPDGSFRIVRLTGIDGPYAVEILPSPDHAVPFAPAHGKGFAPFQVPNGTTHLTGVKLVVDRGP